MLKPRGMGLKRAKNKEEMRCRPPGAPPHDAPPEARRHGRALKPQELGRASAKAHAFTLGSASHSNSRREREHYLSHGWL